MSPNTDKLSLNLIPLELVKKIFYYLISDRQAYVSFASTCKLFSHLANEFQLTSHWKRFRPVTFHADHDCSEPPKDVDCSCNKLNESLIRVDITSTFKSNTTSCKCYFNRLQYLMNCKHRRFSTIRFESSFLQNLECLNSLNDVTILSRINIESLVGVELVGCTVNFHWLQRLLSFLPNLCYLALIDITQAMRRLRTFEYKEESTIRKLDLLKLNGNIPGPLYNEMANYFVTSTLDVSKLTVRAYSADIQIYPPRPRQQLSVMAVLPYVWKCQPLLKHLILDETNIEPDGVKRILRDKDLKELKISVRNCYALTEDIRIALTEELYEDELARVTF